MGAVIWDYVVFAVFLIGCAAMPIYSRFHGPKQKTKADYVFATGRVSMAAMMLSLARGTLGVRSFLGFPSELFYHGSAMWETLYGIILAYPIIAYVFVPVYFNLGITSVYQYLDLRFHSSLVRRLASGTYIIRGVLTMGVTVFIPSVALKAALGLPYWVAIISISGLSISLNIMGGLKSVIQADVIQGLAMMGCSLAIILQGTITVGGVADVVTTSYNDGRLTFLEFNLDPTVPVTTFSALFGQLFICLSIFGCQQNFVQRYCSMKSQSTVTKTLVADIPVIAVLYSLSWVVGMVIYANYRSCDPLSVGLITKIDELLPFYLDDQFFFLPGFLGVVIACLFNGALSMAVSNLNSLSTVTWEDFLKQTPRFSKFTDEKQLCAIRIIGTMYGLFAMGIAFGVGTLSGVVESSQLMASATSGPLLGVFLLAILFPCVNWKGAASGMVVGHILTIWIAIGGLAIDKPRTPMLPLSTEGCINDTFTHWTLDEHQLNTTIKNLLPVVIKETHMSNFLQMVYSISYMYYSLIGCGITILFGVLISYITGHEDTDIYEAKLIHPLALKISQYFPGKPRVYSSDDIRLQVAQDKNKSTDDNIYVIKVNGSNVLPTPTTKSR